MNPVCVVKIGGALVDSGDSLPVLASQIRGLAKDWRVVVVHGGGPQATRMARQHGHEPTIIEGRRITSGLDLEFILAAVCGVVNCQLVAELVGAGLPAVGTSGAAARMVQVTKRPPWHVNAVFIDFGYVGDIETVDPALLLSLLHDGFVPVVATIGVDASGQLYNVNADTTAAAIAVAVEAQRLSIVTDSGGVRKDGRLVHYCDGALFDSGREAGWIKDGMLVKLNAGFSALESGVERVEIVGPDKLVSGAGTELVQSTVTVETP